MVESYMSCSPIRLRENRVISGWMIMKHRPNISSPRITEMAIWPALRFSR